jgi:amidohydrolase
MRTMCARVVMLAAVLSGAVPIAAQTELNEKVDSNIADWIGTYKHLHANPELSTQEKETSAFIASSLRKLGFDVTDHFGKYEDPNLIPYGVVAVLKNGPGPTVYVRTELDALPVRESTGLSYASKVTAKRGNDEVSVMHACGHDLHMTVFLGTAKMLVEEKSHWSGTVVMFAQPAEETAGGAAAMLRAGLFEKFPKPDYVLAFHDSAVTPAGQVAWVEGAIMAGADSVDITIRGYGGHGASPNATKDPIVIGSELVVFLQTIVSREEDPLTPTVITVGSFHAGTKRNIIPDDAHLQLSVRTMSPAQREKTLAAITRAANGIAAAAGVPSELAPIVTVPESGVPPTVNDAELTKRVTTAMAKELGNENVVPGKPLMVSEDFSLYALADPKPRTALFWLGAVDPEKFKDAQEHGTRLPSLHSSEFAPLPEPAIRTGVEGMTSAVMDLLKK